MSRLQLLEKLASGFFVKETITEYTYDDKGEKTPVKEKISEKFINPDPVAVKALAEKLSDKKDLSLLSDEELEKLKKDLIAKLVGGA